ncbi:NAD(P)(+) transhydrogenase (Re/Si-specific) subunit beta [Paraburkholderia fungorum]|uniref:NAD(P)(+) transhydrogenase (Re/Si-specific) subunit beta n=1 Tax=Paraburkholderia fungorum TaxID=134537 RepID=UPI00040F285E|nr:NAD(P)(+) transhydrogenase (Re/Si-specific) subunit beta [Paraburkholderia fungorum]PZR42472.1 MAG: NADP transhydrogenase subunit beta [Paraburkholderia fungorum]QLD51561.1 NADP transhydrogenase subunit beta [Paraburkholderia fungorum]
MTQRPGLVALFGSAMGLAVMVGGFACYLSAAMVTTATPTNVERFELYTAVFIGALVFAACAIAFCMLRGTLNLSAAARPGHGIVNVSALLLCGWLGYGFVTERAQPFGLAALLAMSVLAAALGMHLMANRAYSHFHNSGAYAFGARRHARGDARCHGGTRKQQGVLARIEWHGGEEQTWALREITPGMVRAAAYRHRRGWHDTGKMGAHRHEPVRQHAMHRAMYRQR